MGALTSLVDRVGGVTAAETITLADEQPKNKSVLPTLPEPGQVVEVRGSTWAVADV